ncbi:hypothetical protein D3C81_2156210 [compost metagenome]
MFYGVTRICEVISRARRHLFNHRRRITFSFQFAVCSAVIALCFEWIELTTFPVKCNKPEIVYTR